MLTGKDYCDYETSRELKELGYDEYCCGYYHLTDEEDYNKHSFEMCNGFDFQSSRNRWRVYQAQKWLREEKGLHIEVRWCCNMWYDYEVKEAEGKVLAEGSAFNTYEDALITAIYMATEHLKEK